ncbi:MULTISPECIES: 2'-5' RNA ligase family protein [Croceitalea]|uniref:2'-5' RNA ligase family protein n=1 Tax=Croceitalea vernalis TaxID=3075599 RepID=A0ABU3BDR2_9FLAO|nr:MULTISPECIES: 2'-5' RNA ligase family protein [unclassified Croceitalea]MDT0538606.1 2'-5' RNA ligase family protein [Croceitalea sp. P059]MDT0620390.1 2'-5' RNA ligase family protein [Croceitalea sp. P007]
MEKIRRQLTLFINEPNDIIEKIRAKFNPEQYNLIPAHVTLCREDEIEPIVKTIARIESIRLEKPIRIEFGKALRFSDGKGVYLSSFGHNKEFKELRKLVLGPNELKKEQVPHITLMHPRNSTCTDEKFERIENYSLPKVLELGKISLIEQKNGGKWNVLREFNIVKNNASHQQL